MNTIIIVIIDIKIKDYKFYFYIKNNYENILEIIDKKDSARSLALYELERGIRNTSTDGIKRSIDEKEIYNYTDKYIIDKSKDYFYEKFINIMWLKINYQFNRVERIDEDEVSLWLVKTIIALFN